MGKGEIGTIQEIGTPALGVKFPGMSKIHKWYVDDEVEAATEPEEKKTDPASVLFPNG